MHLKQISWAAGIRHFLRPRANTLSDLAMRSHTASTLSRETGRPSVVLVCSDKNRTTASILPGISWSRPTYLPPPAATIKAIHCSLSFERSASPAILGRGLGLSTLIQTSAPLDLFLAADGGSCASEVRCDGWAKETLRRSAISCIPRRNPAVES